jgi:hypothetical protein
MACESAQSVLIDGSRDAPIAYRTENDDFLPDADFSSQRPRLFRGFNPPACGSASAAAVLHSLNDSFDVHCEKSGTDTATKLRPSGSGVSFATQPLRSRSDRHRDHGFEQAGNRYMLRYRLLKEVFTAAEPESSAPDPPASQSAALARLAAGSERESGGFAVQDGPGHAYNEEAFQYFLEIERKRSELSNRPFLLMLVDFNKHPRIEAVTADKLFSVLSVCFRETDFIGWYRGGRVAGAVLTQHGETDGDDLSDVVRQRIGGAIRQRLPPDLARQLQVRVYQIPPHVKSEND